MFFEIAPYLNCISITFSEHESLGMQRELAFISSRVTLKSEQLLLDPHDLIDINLLYNAVKVAACDVRYLLFLTPLLVPSVFYTVLECKSISTLTVCTNQSCSYNGA